MAAGLPQGSKHVPVPHCAAQPLVLITGKGVPITTGCENQRAYVRAIWKATGDPGTVGLEGPAYRLTCSRSLCRGGSVVSGI